jgi:aryl-alcohol dehydrogenase-like predicted oxidoreductase
MAANMRHKLLGRSGLRVSELCLGTMTFGGGVGSLGVGGSDDRESRAMFDAFAEAGGTFLDTACSYSGGRSEELLGDFVAADRDRFVIGTKYTNSHRGGLALSGNSRRNMVRSVEASLKRLKTDRIDLFWLHLWDFTTPVDEVLRAFDDLTAAGKVLYIGASDTPAWEISRANAMADLLGMTPFIAIQIEYSLLERTAENDLMPMAKALDLGITAWSPLAAGMLARASDERQAAQRRPGRELSPAEREITRTVREIAAQIGATPAQVALAAIRQHNRYGQVIPILGAREPGQLQDCLGCLGITLDEAQRSRLQSLSEPALSFPHRVIRSPVALNLTTGGEGHLLDNHRR